MKGRVLLISIIIVALVLVYSQIKFYESIGNIKKTIGATEQTNALSSQLETLTQQINELNQKMNKLEQILDRVLTRYSYRIESIQVSIDPRDFVDVKEYGGPDPRVFIYLNSKAIIKTPVRENTYSAKWTYPIRTKDFFGSVQEIVAEKFDFRLSDNLEIWLFDEDASKYDIIAYWNPNIPEELKSLSTKNGTKVKIELDLIKTKKYSIR